MQKQEYQVQAEDSGRVDRLVARLLTFSRARVRGLIDHGGVEVNGQTCSDAGLTLAPGDRVSLQYDPKRQYREKPVERRTQGFQIIYRDDSLVVVNKEAGLLTVPTDRRESQTLIDRLSRFIFGPQSRQKMALVHRLDRDTSGLLVFGCRHSIAEQVIKQFAERKPEREYIAVVKGAVAQDEGEIRSFLSSDKSLNQKSSARGELAITHYKVLKRRPDATLVSVRLETGRRNQIRVHFAEMGHPILGDQRYRPEDARHRDWPYKRLALHAQVLGFVHPETKKSLRFTQAPPQEFQRFL